MREQKMCTDVVYLLEKDQLLFGKLERWCTGGAEDYMSSKLVFDSPYVSVWKSKRAIIVYMNLAYIKRVQ